MLDISVFSVHPFPRWSSARSVMAVQLFQVVLVSSTGCCPQPTPALLLLLLHPSCTLYCSALLQGEQQKQEQGPAWLPVQPDSSLLTTPLSTFLNPLLRLNLDSSLQLLC